MAMVKRELEKLCDDVIESNPKIVTFYQEKATAHITRNALRDWLVDKVQKKCDVEYVIVKDMMEARLDNGELPYVE